MINSGQLCTLVILNRIGIGVIKEALQSAAYYLTHSNGNNMRQLNEASQSFTFVSGTGLDVIINYYHLDYNSDRLKDAFYCTVGRRDLIE